MTRPDPTGTHITAGDLADLLGTQTRPAHQVQDEDQAHTKVLG